MGNLLSQKRNILKRRLADIANPESQRLQDLKQSKRAEEGMKTYNFYRYRPQRKDEIIKPWNAFESKKLRKEEGLLGISALT